MFIKSFSKNLLPLLLTILFAASGFAQIQHTPGKERGNPQFRTKGQMEGNKIRTTIFNHGQSGRYGGEFPITVQTPYEWPKNTGKVYLALQGVFVGGEVIDNNGTAQKIIDVMNYRQSPDGKSWNIEPVPGYYNESKDPREIATSVDQTTWPAFWPDKLQADVDPGWRGSWNGYFGKNIFQADQEMFYRSSDDMYTRYANYFPDTTDLTRKGLGIIMDVRTLAWSQILVEDALYILHFIKNDGTKNIPKVAVTIWYADFVGGDGDSQDDISEFDLIEDIAWTRDNDHRAISFGSDPVGIVAVAFLETPGNALDRIDNDGDGEPGGPKITEAMLDGEIPDNLIDDNGNGLIDENQTHIPFGVQLGVSYADRINQGDLPGIQVEQNSPVVTAEMVSQATGDRWKRWPSNPENDPVQLGAVHLIMVEADDIGREFADFIDNDDDGEEGSPVITQEIINLAANDAPYYRYRVPGTNIILYDVKQEDIGKKYADGVDNDGNGAVDENIDEGIDEMIDEARDDGIDNDGDWNPLTDDVGLDGVPNTGDFGEGDGKPTSGAGTGLPGEPNIDVTDVAETDQIGITNAQYVAAGGLNINSDASMWFDFMIPGKFYNPLVVVAGEYDLFVSSGFFPLRAGQTEPISLAVLFANGPVPDPNGQFRKREILKKRVRAQETYNNDYQFANAPVTPTVTAVPGDKRVTLYWDDVAEFSFDKYINNIGGIGEDFEGYRIYRASDPAFQDAEQITNAYGTLVFKLPIAIFDKVDGIQGLDSVGFEGVHYDLGTDSGLRHSWVDTSVQNGYSYYYAVTSYDFGFPGGGIIPSESPIRISLQADGSVRLGTNVVKVTPEAPSAGFVPATLGQVNHLEGSSTGSIFYEIIDKNKLRDGHVYNITFEDTLIVGTQGKPDTLRTKNFSLIDSTENRIVIDKSSAFGANIEQPLTDGFRLTMINESRVEVNAALSKWTSTDVPHFVFEKLITTSVKGQETLNDFLIIFDEVGFASSKEIRLGTNTFPSKPVNFKVFNKSTNQFIEFGFIEVDQTDGEGKLTAKAANKDRIVFVEKTTLGADIFTWWFYLAAAPGSGQRFPQAGDTATVILRKPFLSIDKFSFVAQSDKIDLDKAREDLDKIKVVPNPYVAYADWEEKNPYTSGRGPRELHFTHLPNRCTIRIFTVNGELVDIIEHDTPFSDGTARWDMLTRDNLAISYGVYVFHIDAPGIGQRTGKFAVIK